MDLSQLKHILFLDIETVSQKPELDQLDERFINLWEKKTKNAKSELSPADFYKERASISAEFGRIIVIGLGYFTSENNETIFRCKSIAGDNEKNILEEFNLFLEKLSGKENWKLCAHNGKEFDFPYLCRRMLINELPLPKLLQIMGKKPWETAHLLDTMEMWKFGDVKAYTSLELMAASLGVPTSKGDIDGSQVGQVYFETGDVKRIALYCQKDVAVMAQVYMKISGLGSLKPESIFLKID
jgi:predicted PolB exonuclease-like 3'-5' exonuclease